MRFHYQEASATAEKVSYFMAKNTTQQHGAGETRKAPSQSPWLLGTIRVMNALPKLILRSPLHVLMSKQLLLLTYTGRKSGKRYTFPITYAKVGNTLLLATDRPWWKNLRGGAQVQVWLRGKKHSARAEVVTDEATETARPKQAKGRTAAKKSSKKTAAKKTAAKR